MKSLSSGNSFRGRLAAWDAVLALCWLSGICLGCICGALAYGMIPNTLPVLLNCGAGVAPLILPYMDFVAAFSLQWVDGGDFILLLAFAKGFGDAFVLCLLLSAPGCFGWPYLFVPFGQQLALAPARFSLWRWILRDSRASNALWLIVLYCICVFLFFVFMSVF